MIKLQINSPEVLKRIIGDDDTLEVEIKNAIIASLRGEPLKRFVSESALSSAIISELFDISGSSYSPVYKMKDRLSPLLEIAITNTLTDFITGTLMERSGIVAKLNNIIEQQSNRIVNEFTDSAIQDRINNMVDRKIKEKLGLS